MATIEFDIVRRRVATQLVSGFGSNLQALIDATAGPSYGVRISAVAAARADIEALVLASRDGVHPFLCRVAAFATRAGLNPPLARPVAAHTPARAGLAIL